MRASQACDYLGGELSVHWLPQMGDQGTGPFLYNSGFLS